MDVLEPRMRPCEASRPKSSPSKAFRLEICSPTSHEVGRSTNEAIWLWRKPRPDMWQFFATFQLSCRSRRIHWSDGQYVNVQNKEMSSREFTKKMNTRNIKNMEKTNGYLMKEFIFIVMVCDRDVFIKSVCANALDHPLLGLCHYIINLSGSYLGNMSGFTVMSHCKVRSSGMSLYKKWPCEQKQ